MKTNKMLVIGEKESFIVRVLVKKALDADVECEFVHWSINEINAKLGDVHLITVYIDDDTPPSAEVLHYLNDMVDEKGIQLIIIGEPDDTAELRQMIPKESIYGIFVRPVDNELFVWTIKEYYQKVEAGEFKKSILIVDDDPQYLSIVREWLRGTYKVSMANSGLQAIKMLGKNKVDLILLDHEMPVTSGPQVLEMLRSDDETKDIPVMFLTGKSDKKSVMSVVDLRPQGYFLKTIKKDELLDKLREYFMLHK
ncbi:MAG: response regulator [Lachnospiraceae bacterium]|nr:response regulator [Lachnospiraceae bacterium]